MLDHQAIGVPDTAASRRFPEAALAPLDGAVRPRLYGAFALDPDGNRAEAVRHRPR